MSSSPLGHQPNYSAENNLSPYKNVRDRSVSRPSSRTSLRAHSPSFSLDDPVAVRNQMSTLKHNIRQQQAQLNSLESIVRSGPRPYGPELTDDNYNTMAASSSTSPPPSSFVPTTSQTSTKMKRRSSHDVLLSLAGPDSSLPIPKRELGDENGIREGIPSNYPATPTSYKRGPSPTRTLSRIPVSSVGNARALADEGATSRPPSKLSALDPADASSSSLQPPPSPNKRLSLTPGGTTKVLADLQTGVVNARNALENTKQQLRLSQRSVAQLTRQTEDLKEGRERLRLENEGLNNVVARKERLLQEVLERARKAEAEAAALKAQLKTETSTSKKTIREMESALSESTALSQKSEREYITLRDGLKGMSESWKQDTDRLREEMRKREEKLQNEAQRVGKMYRELVEQVQKANESREEVKKLKEEDRKKTEEVESYWTKEIEAMKGEVESEGRNTDEANRIAKHLSEELARLRRLMRAAGRRTSEDTPSSIPQKLDPPP
ncbi:hypothetical protein GALMADRAFT_241310 [Galerina marginata CBS 339.88]|uniref:SWI5-dependent HO expression protein 3 n=1 Tax=Galerina marginata (strain CBS 339.88) TaxID=685588 RepID=A0A067TPE7_GALM3|nr:hypothetical protein GALMADRAFT_241310 [Galerina marginata CBS 339.88]